MDRKLITTMAATIGFGSAVFALPANSYINRPIKSPRDLVKHIQSDPVVADRYERHFGVSKSEVLMIIEGLHAEKLKYSGTYTVWNVPSATGELRVRTLKLNAGTRVFSDGMGRPILMQICGNPLVPGRSLVRSEDPNPVLVGTPKDVVTQFVGVPSTPVATPVFVNEPAVPDIAPEPVVTVLPSRSSSPWLGALLLIPALAVITSGGDSDDPVDPVDPVPEPASMIALGAGSAALIARSRRRR